MSIRYELQVFYTEVLKQNPSDQSANNIQVNQITSTIVQRLFSDTENEIILKLANSITTSGA